jgi:hypothetical protein
MAIKKKQKARDRSKEKTVEVPRHAAKVFQKRQDQLDARKARVGDVVTSQDHTGVFKVLSVSPNGLAELQPFHIGKQEAFGKVMTHVPVSRLRRYKEDASQAAARIVREATEDR